MKPRPGATSLPLSLEDDPSFCWLSGDSNRLLTDSSPMPLPLGHRVGFVTITHSADDFKRLLKHYHILALQVNVRGHLLSSCGTVQTLIYIYVYLFIYIYNK